jgi:hypothetical protein
MSDDTFGYAKHNMRTGDTVQIRVDLRTVEGKQTATMFSPDLELTSLGKTLLLNWLRVKDGAELPDGVCLIRLKTAFRRHIGHK